MKTATSTPYRTDIPARLDRLPWSRFHWLVVIALGASWAIDGLEVTLKGRGQRGAAGPALARALEHRRSASRRPSYLLGAVVGALFCGHLTDRYGRARLFFITMGIYLARHAADRVLVGFREPVRVSRGHGLRHRRRVCGDQLGDRRADSRARARPREPHHQRQLLARRGRGIGRDGGAARSRGISRSTSAGASASRSARRSASSCSSRGASFPKARAGSRSTAIARARRDAVAEIEARIERETGRGAARPRRRALTIRPRTHTGHRRRVRDDVQALPPALDPLLRADHVAGVSLQRDFLHLRARADALLRRAVAAHRALSAAVRDRQFSRTARCSDTSSTRSGGAS